MKLLLAALIFLTAITSTDARCRIEHQFLGPNIKIGCHHKHRHHVARKKPSKAFGLAIVPANPPVMQDDTWNAALQRCSAEYERQRRAGR